MQALATLLAAMFTKTFASMAARFGLQTAITGALIAVWVLLVAALTTATNICFGQNSVCSAAISSTTGLPEVFVFGLSLIPIQAVTVLECLVALHTAGWAAIALWRVVKLKHEASSKGLMVR